MRSDGRAPDQLRQVKITTNYVRHPEGSALVEMGDTRVAIIAASEEFTSPYRAVRAITCAIPYYPENRQLQMLLGDARHDMRKMMLHTRYG